jgi:hypothetical protein
MEYFAKGLRSVGRPRELEKKALFTVQLSFSMDA